MLLGALLLLCEVMMSFTSYSPNWLIDTSNSLVFKPDTFFSRSYKYYIGQMLCVAEIEKVDIQDCYGLVYELVMLPQWHILSKAVIYLLTVVLFDLRDLLPI